MIKTHTHIIELWRKLSSSTTNCNDDFCVYIVGHVYLVFSGLHGNDRKASIPLCITYDNEEGFHKFSSILTQEENLCTSLEYLVQNMSPKWEIISAKKFVSMYVFIKENQNMATLNNN